MPQLPRTGRRGGKRGPELDRVAVQLAQDQLIRQVIQGGGNMPAYGKNLSPAETTALVAFLETLHPSGLTRHATPLAAVKMERSSRTTMASLFVTLALIAVEFLYLRGWYQLRNAIPQLLSVWRLAA